MIHKWKVVFLMLCCIGISVVAPAQKKKQNNNGLTKEELAVYET